MRHNQKISLHNYTEKTKLNYIPKVKIKQVNYKFIECDSTAVEMIKTQLSDEKS